jgi:hypothetical protein
VILICSGVCAIASLSPLRALLPLHLYPRLATRQALGGLWAAFSRSAVVTRESRANSRTTIEKGAWLVTRKSLPRIEAG